ncbi:spherulin-4 [Selaginella moellendorffii]|uniref:spherulin-4 n=1 Tax=Selaginella moellendorffii TaxID=88036 RepID=UPI000D1CC334|nr:spherulin-4 [Selaginella moellendorffii]|eukprot:XP_024531904.1 spherulin-4 [Selaginella moellendorffii]
MREGWLLTWLLTPMTRTLTCTTLPIRNDEIEHVIDKDLSRVYPENGSLRKILKIMNRKMPSLALLFFQVLSLACQVVWSQSCEQMRIMVPAYFDPSSNSQAWSSLNSAATTLPNRVVAIANPSNGPGSAAQSSYQNVITALQRQTGLVIGYVSTNYSNRASNLVQDDVDTWYRFYPTINGIFFDEVANTDGEQPYYQSLYNYVKSKNSSSLVVNNPGAPTLETYLFYNGSRVADVICIFESGVGGLSMTQSSWTSKYSRYNFYALFYNVTDVNVSSFDYGDVIDRAYQQNVGWVYVTNDNLPNPWDTIASYFSGEVDYIKNDNQC